MVSAGSQSVTKSIINASIRRSLLLNESDNFGSGSGEEEEEEGGAGVVVVGVVGSSGNMNISSLNQLEAPPSPPSMSPSPPSMSPSPPSPFSGGLSSAPQSAREPRRDIFKKIESLQETRLMEK